MEWKEVRLGDVCSELSDGLHKAPKFIVNGEYIFVNAKNLYNGYILDNDPTKKTSHEEYLKYKKPLGKHSILYSIDGTIGNIAKYRGEKCVLGKGACYINCNPEIVESSYLYYQLQSPHFKSYIHLMSTGSTIKHISLKTMRDYVFELPSLEDQHRIASILSSLDRKIELNNKINADLEEMAQAIFKNWFVDFEPFKDGKFVDSELGMIPEGWKVGTLDEIADITMGQSPAGNSLNEKREGMIFYQGSSDFGFRFPSIRVFTTEPKRLAVVNSVLFSVRAPVGDINVTKEECCIGRGVASIKSKYGHDSYLFYTMKSLHKLFDSFDGEGTVFGSINKKTLSAIQILLPSDGIVEQFNDIASSFDNRIRSLSDENSRLSLLRDTLLPRLMSGELEVPE